MLMTTINNIVATYSDMYGSIRFDYDTNQFEPCDCMIESQLYSASANQLAEVLQVIEDMAIVNHISNIRHYKLNETITDYVFKDIVTLSFNYTTRKLNIYSQYLPSGKFSILFSRINNSRLVELLEIIETNRPK